MFILQTMQHASESCPLGNSKSLNIVIKWLENLENLTAKYREFYIFLYYKVFLMIFFEIFPYIEIFTS